MGAPYRERHICYPGKVSGCVEHAVNSILTTSDRTDLENIRPPPPARGTHTICMQPYPCTGLGRDFGQADHSTSNIEPVEAPPWLAAQHMSLYGHTSASQAPAAEQGRNTMAPVTCVDLTVPSDRHSTGSPPLCASVNFRQQEEHVLWLWHTARTRAGPLGASGHTDDLKKREDRPRTAANNSPHRCRRPQLICQTLPA